MTAKSLGPGYNTSSIENSAEYKSKANEEEKENYMTD
jgi:hypothetical protein